MARKLMFLFLLVVFSIPSFVGVAQLPVDVPREEVFVVDALLRAPVPNNHNYWITGPWPGITHALTMDTLWIRDQETGERVKDVAISDPMYNDDFTQMSVDLRDNIYWSDGVQFTADDLIFTVETLKANPDLNAYGWSANLNKSMASVEKTGDFSVTFHL
ncbi:MAG: ABC transporter substrate-binding protein, partial [Chloroflexi bacterium]|nr:ABC transporter substrate-binding protein [Chloroflexota bacterium]